MACPVCQDLTPTDLCAKCRGMSQKSAVILTTRMHRWERTYQHLAEVSCQDCCHVACSLCQSEITQFSNFFYLFLRFVTAVLVLVIPSYVVCLWTARYFTSSCNVHVTWGHLNISGRSLTVCNNKKTPTTTGMSPQGRKLDRRWRQQKRINCIPCGNGWYFKENTHLRIVACLCWVSNGTNCNLIFFLVKKLWLI